MTTPAHCSVATLAKLLNLSERRIYQLVKEGIIPKVKSGQYDILGSIQGYLQHLQLPDTQTNTDHQQQKARLITLQADLLALRLARENHQLISVKVVNDTWADITIRARQTLLGMAPGLAAKVTLLSEVKDITQCIHQEIEAVLDLLAQPNYGEQNTEDALIAEELEYDMA